MFVPRKLIANNQSIENISIETAMRCLQFLGMFIYTANLQGIISVKPHRKTRRQKQGLGGQTVSTLEWDQLHIILRYTRTLLLVSAMGL